MRRFIFLVLVAFVVTCFARVDTLYVTDGMYVDQSHYDDPGTDGAVVLLSATGSPVTIFVNAIIRNGVDVRHGDSVTVEYDVWGPTINTYSILGSNSGIYGGKVKNTSDNGSAIYIDGDHNIIQRVEIDSSVAGIYISEGSRDILIDTCGISHCVEIGIKLCQSTEVKMRFTMITSCYDYGVFGADSVVFECDYSNNISYCPIGAHFQEGSRVKYFETLGYCYVRNLELINVNRAHIQGSRFGGLDGACIYVEAVDSFYCSKCIFMGGDSGIVMNNVSVAKISHNNIMGPLYSIWINGFGSYDIFNNIFTNGQHAVGSSDSVSVRLLTNNHIWHMTDPWYNVGPSLNVTSGDPWWTEFVDFTLYPGSLCDGTGYTTDGTSTDRGVTGGNDNWWGLPEVLLVYEPPISSDLAIVVFPNPFNSTLEISGVPENGVGYIYDLGGCLITIVKNGPWTAPDGLPSGNYLLVVRSEDGEYSQVLSYVK